MDEFILQDLINQAHHAETVEEVRLILVDLLERLQAADRIKYDQYAKGDA